MGIIGTAFVGTNQVFGAAVPPAWTPASFTDVKYWWTADAGVSRAGGAVISWVDQIASFDMQQTVGANQPTLTTSATLNGQNTIKFNGVDEYLWTTTSPSFQGITADLTMLSVINLIDVKTGGVFMGCVIIAPGSRMWVDTLSSNIRIFNENYPNNIGTGTTLESPATTGAKAIKLRYDSSAGDGFYAINTLTETSYATGGATGTINWESGATVALGATINNTGGSVFGGRYVQVEVAEQVWVENTPSATEMDDWKTYVNNKYGTIIV